ncbi:MAG: hypothetical protein ACI9K1_002361 [Arcticibacterium sp.]|jgi:hypothetical protein
MASKKEETASFVLRLSQKIYNSENGEAKLQWRGNIRHVQSGEEKRFANYEDATEFVQSKLSDITMAAIEDKPEKDKKGILSQSFDFWKNMALNAPKIVMDSIKDPKGQAEQIQQQITQFNDSISRKFEDKFGSKLELNNWSLASKADQNELLEAIAKLSDKVDGLSEKVAALDSNDKNS